MRSDAGIRTRQPHSRRWRSRPPRLVQYGSSWSSAASPSTATAPAAAGVKAGPPIPWPSPSRAWTSGVAAGPPDLTHRAPEPSPELGQLVRPEHEEGQDHDDEELLDADLQHGAGRIL